MRFFGSLRHQLHPLLTFLALAHFSVDEDANQTASRQTRYRRAGSIMPEGDKRDTPNNGSHCHDKSGRKT